MVTPLHYILIFIILLPIFWLKYGEYIFEFATLYIFLLLIYGYRYYKKSADKNNTTIFHELKRDIPSFGIPDMNIFSIIMLLILLLPFWIWIFL